MSCPPAAVLEPPADVELLGSATAPPQGYYSWPAVSGLRLAFVCEGSVWVGVLPGQGAGRCEPRRVTDGAGVASHLVFSPDGALLAYTLEEHKHEEVYACAAQGGASRRLTYQGARRCRVVGWSRDGRAVLFASEAPCPDNAVSGELCLWQVPLAGGAPVPLGLGESSSLELEPSADGVLLGRHTGDPAVDEWKGYRGGRCGQLWIDPRGAGTFTQLQPLPSPAQIGAPLWLGERIFFVSDLGEAADIYSCDTAGADLRAHGVHAAHPGFYPRRPASDGRTLVYAAAGRLFRLSVDDLLQRERAAAPTEIEIEWLSPRSALAPYLTSAVDGVSDLSLHPGGATLAVATRGQAFHLGVFSGPAVALLPPPSVEGQPATAGRSRMVAHLADGLRLLVVSDFGGEDRIELHRLDGSQPAAVLELEPESLGRVEELCPHPHDRGVVALTNHR